MGHRCTCSEPPQRTKVSEKPYTLAALCARELPVEQIEQGAAWTPAGVQLGWGIGVDVPRRQNPRRSKMQQKNEFF